MKRIGFLSFGHYRHVVGARVPDAAAALRQHVDLARIADEVGLDGAWVRVHHFEESHASPMPLLAAMAAVTTRIDVGTGVLDLRYENPLHLAEQAAATDLLSGGRLQLGISRGSPEHAVDGQKQFGYRLSDGESWADHAHSKAARFRRAIAGEPVAHSAAAHAAGDGPDLPIRPLSPGLPDRIWWGAGSAESGVWTAEQGMNLLSSTLLLAEDGRPPHPRQWRKCFCQSGCSAAGAASSQTGQPQPPAPRATLCRRHQGKRPGPDKWCQRYASDWAGYKYSWC